MIGMKIDFPGNPQELRKIYEAVNDDIGRIVDFKTNGIIMHTAGPIPSGWRVLDFWESPEKLDAFTQQIMPVLQKHGLPAAQPEIWEISNSNPGKPKS